MKRLKWTEDAVLSVQLRPDLYTLAQMRRNSLMQFFDIRSEDGEWAGVDLTDVAPLFCVYVAERRLKPVLVDYVPPDAAKPNRRPTPTLMLDYRFSGDGDHKADLIELTDAYTSIDAPVVQEGLTIEHDLDVIYGHEYVGMFGDPEKLRTRLVRWFDTGVNWDDSKTFVFKGIQPPPPAPGRSPAPAPTTEPPAPEPSPAKPADLAAYGETDYLQAVHPPLRRKVQPHFTELLAQIEALPAESPEPQVLSHFQACIESLNQYGDDIQTVDREALLAAVYDIGAFAGLDPESRFADRWRGDW